MRCASCGVENPESTKFCEEYGTPFVRTCPSCGQLEHFREQGNGAVRLVGGTVPDLGMERRHISPRYAVHLPVTPGWDNMLVDTAPVVVGRALTGGVSFEVCFAECLYGLALASLPPLL